MAELSPAGTDIAILIAGALLYAFIWFATRNLSRGAKILARVAPLGLIIPLMIYLSMVPAARQPNFASKEAAAPAKGYAKAAPDGDADRAAMRAEEERAAAQRRVLQAPPGQGHAPPCAR